jgi:hypothetical protein
LAKRHAPRGKDDSGDTPKWRGYYVYGLADPTTGEVFYVGKGTGPRRDRHVAQWRKDRHPNPFVSARLTACGGACEVRCLADGLTEDAALRLEAKLINEGDGLANIAHGMSWQARQMAACASLLARLKPLNESSSALHRATVAEATAISEGRHLVPPVIISGVSTRAEIDAYWSGEWQNAPL